MYAARGGFHKINCRFGIYHAKSVSLQAGGRADMQPCSGPIRFFYYHSPAYIENYVQDPTYHKEPYNNQCHNVPGRNGIKELRH